MRKIIFMSLLFAWLGFQLAFNLSSRAHATTFCNVPKTSDGFVALRAAPNARAPLVGKMRSGDEVLIGLGERGRWIEVTWWRGMDRHEKGYEHNAGAGWMHKRFVGEECG